MDDLAAWLLERIAEDEEMAQIGSSAHIPHDCWGPDRVLAECEVKRRIVEPWTGADSDEYSTHQEDNWRYGIHADAHERILRILALQYADRPGYRQEWRP